MRHNTAAITFRVLRFFVLTLIASTAAISCFPIGSRSLPEAIQNQDFEEMRPAGTSGDWVCPSSPLLPSFNPTLYVSTEGSDTNDGRAHDTPLRTLAKAAALVQPGDVVWLRSGTYEASATFIHSGSAGAPIVFESQPGECAILDGHNVNSGSALRFDNVSNTLFRNFIVRNSPDEGVFMSGSHSNILTNLITYDNGESGILSIGGNNNVFAYIISYRNFDQPAGQDADGISISSGNGNHVYTCITFDNSDDGVDTWRSTNTLVERCVSFHNGFQGGDGNGFKAGGREPAAHTTIRNSIAFANRTNGFDYNSGRGVTFDNNTAFNNGHYGLVLDGGAARNNLSYGNQLGNWVSHNTATIQQANSWNLRITELPFVSILQHERGFMSLNRNNAALAAGIDVGLPFSGAAPDLGALPSGETIQSFLGIMLKNLPPY